MEFDSVVYADRKTIASRGGLNVYGRQVRLWDADSGRFLGNFTGHTRHATSLAISSDGGTLASGEHGGTIRVWEVGIGDPLRVGDLLETLVGHTKYAGTLAFSPDGGTLASGSYDGTLRLWDLRISKHLKTLTEGHKLGQSGGLFAGWDSAGEWKRG